MTALSFSITTNTTSAGQVLTAAATTFAYSGNDQSYVDIQVWSADTAASYSSIGQLNPGDVAVFAVPSGWYVRVVSAGIGAVIATGTVVVE